MLYNFTFLLSSLFFFFLKIWSEIGMRIIHGRALYTGKYGTCMSLFNHWRKEYKRNNAVVVKPQEQRKCDFTPFYVWVMLLFRQGPDSLKEHIYPSFRAQSNRWQCEKQCAHQIQKNTSTHKLRKPLNPKEWTFSLTLCKAQGIFKMSVINYCP